MKTRLLSALGLVLALSAPVFGQTLTVGGTGSSDPLVRKLFEDFRKQVPEASLSVVTPPLGSGGTAKALAGKRIDLGFMGRQPSLEEKSRLGRSFPIAVTPLVFASLQGPRQPGFSLDQLAQIHEGQVTQWDTGKSIRLILRGRYESDTLTLKNMSPAMSQAVTNALNRPGMVVADNDLDTIDLLTRTSGSLGPTTLGLLSTLGVKGLQVHPINGQMPSLATYKNGSYPWVKTLILALPEKPSPLAERFVAYLQSGAARIVMQRYDYLPVTP